MSLRLKIAVRKTLYHKDEIENQKRFDSSEDNGKLQDDPTFIDDSEKHTCSVSY